MKKTISIILVVLIGTSLQAQLSNLLKGRTGGSSERTTAFTRGVEEVLSDFPYNYKHITGDLVLAQGEWEQYASMVKLPGAESCVVGRYHSALDTTASWQALMYRNENFNAASREYRTLYQQLKGCQAKMIDGSVFYLRGDYEEPSESLDFVTSELRLQTSDHRYKEFKVELEMVYEMTTREWIIHINMDSKKKDSEMGPDWLTEAN